MGESKNYKDWFEFADMDLSSAKFLFDKMYKKPYEIICYHCQQAAEKFIKGVMLYFGDDIIKTHDLPKLRNKLKGKVDTNEIAIECEMLTPFAVLSRYPLAIEVDESQTKVAIAEAEKVKAWAENIVKL